MGNFQCCNANKAIILGYYPMRGKAQMMRMLCEYLHVNYKDQFLTPDQWQKYKNKEARDWIVKDLPFLIDGTFHVTGAGCLYYIVEKAKRTDMLGKNAADFIKINSLRNKKDVLHALLGIGMGSRSCNPVEEAQRVQKHWQQKMEPLLTKLEVDAKPNDWYLGYISILDFFFHEVVIVLQTNFPSQLGKFPKLVALKEKVSAIPEIENYEKSGRSLKECCPKTYFDKYKAEVSQMEGNTKTSSSNCEMDVE